MSERLLDTAHRGFLSDPLGIPLYYRMGIDRDGLTVYRAIRGTNSVKGGVHMAVRRVFGSLQASPELKSTDQNTMNRPHLFCPYDYAHICRVSFLIFVQ
jgi:hypothetical protein